MLGLISLVAAQVVTFAPGSRLWIEGDSNLHAWSCQAKEPKARMEIDLEAAQIARSLNLEVQVAALECGDGHMNEKLRDALKSNEHPVIEYRLVKAERMPGDPIRLEATGELTIAGRTRTVTFDVDVEIAADRSAQARGKVDILMTDFGVEPPTALLVLKTYDKVTVHFEVRTALISSTHAALP